MQDIFLSFHFRWTSFGFPPSSSQLLITCVVISLKAAENTHKLSTPTQKWSRKIEHLALTIVNLREDNTESNDRAEKWTIDAKTTLNNPLSFSLLLWLSWLNLNLLLFSGAGILYIFSIRKHKWGGIEMNLSKSATVSYYITCALCSLLYGNKSHIEWRYVKNI